MPKAKGPRRIHRYETEFKVQDVAESLDIHPFMHVATAYRELLNLRRQGHKTKQ